KSIATSSGSPMPTTTQSITAKTTAVTASLSESNIMPASTTGTSTNTPLVTASTGAGKSSSAATSSTIMKSTITAHSLPSSTSIKLTNGHTTCMPSTTSTVAKKTLINSATIVPSISSNLLSSSKAIASFISSTLKLATTSSNSNSAINAVTTASYVTS